MMFKGSLPPTIAIAMYQAPSVAEEYSTLGFLVAISSVLGFCIMPRGKFIQTMSLNIVAICFSAAINLLALFCVVKAREHTTAPGTTPGSYNSSACAVCAIWLIFEVYVINVLRAARPQLQFPAILGSIFVIVSLSYGVVFPDIPTALSFMKRLLTTFLTGFSLATAVSFIVLPTSSRKVVFKEMDGYLNLINGILKTQTAYMASLETYDPMKKTANGTEQTKKSKRKTQRPPKELMLTPPAVKLREMMRKIFDLHTKLHGDVYVY